MARWAVVAVTEHLLMKRCFRPHESSKIYSPGCDSIVEMLIHIVCYGGRAPAMTDGLIIT